jgi:hypothetical protein
MNYYDLVLGLIPFGLATIASTLVVSGVAVTGAVAIASVFAAGLIGHAMFVRAPVDPAPEPVVEGPAPAPATADGAVPQAD